MSFHFVDRIYHLDSKKAAHGLKNVTRCESFFYPLPTGELVLSPAVVTEALAQLGSWLKMFSTDFTKRPVLLADECSYYNRVVKPGDQIDLHVKILDFDDEVVVSQSYAEVAGERVLTTECCRGYLLPMEEFEDRLRVIKQFESLYKPAMTHVRPLKQSILPVECLNPPREQRWDFVDALTEHTPFKKVVGFKNFSASEPYFATHFPYKPVVPGVLLMTLVGEVSQFLVHSNLNKHDHKKMLVPMFVQNARFRKFVEPGDQCIVTVELKDGDLSADDSDVIVAAQIYANDKRVMQADMGFRTMYGAESPALQRPNPLAGRITQ